MESHVLAARTSKYEKAQANGYWPNKDMGGAEPTVKNTKTIKSWKRFTLCS